MNCFIFIFYTAHLLTGISAWLLTTPMQSALHSKTKNDATSQITKIVKIIELINSAYTDNGRNIGHSGRVGGLHSKHVSRRFELPALEIKKRPESLVPKEDDKETQLEKNTEAVRYYVIDNPQVLAEYSNKRKKKKNLKRYLMRKKRSSEIIDNRSLGAKYYHSDVKLKRHHKNAALKAGSHNSSNKTFIQTSSHHPTNPNYELDGDLELTNIESTYQPKFTEDNKDNDISLLRTTKKENNKPGADKKKHALSAKIFNTNKFDKRTGIKARGMKHIVIVPEVNAHKDNLNDTGANKIQSLPLHNENDNKNDQVTKMEENKEFHYNRNVRRRADNLNPKTNDYYFNNAGEKEKKDIEPQQKSKIKNKRKHTTSRKHKRKSNKEREEGHLIHVQQDRNENSTKHHKKKHEKIVNYDKEVKEDKKRNDKRNREEESDLNNSDYQRFHDSYDRMEYEWNKRHLQYVKKENSSNDNKRGRNDEEWTRKHYDSINKENNWHKRDEKLNKRERNLNRKGSRILQDRRLNLRESMVYEIEKGGATLVKKARR